MAKKVTKQQGKSKAKSKKSRATKSSRSARKTTRRAATKAKGEHLGRSLWTGSLSFGLLNIPVSLASAQEEAPVGFDMIDKRNYGRIGYRQYNKTTGKEVTRNQIVKGYEYKPGEYVLLTDEDFKRANPRAVSTIDIEDFVVLSEMDPMLFEKPYYLNPSKGGEKGYRLLRDVMKRTGKVAIGRAVLFRKQRLVAIIPRGEYLVLEQLRFAREILTSDEMASLDRRLKDVKIAPREIEMAESLVNGMTAKWNPDKYEDTYHQDLIKLLEAKAKKGTIEPAEEAEEIVSVDEETPKGKVVDLMPLLKKSLEGRKGKSDHGSRRVSS